MGGSTHLKMFPFSFSLVHYLLKKNLLPDVIFGCNIMSNYPNNHLTLIGATFKKKTIQGVENRNH